MQGKIPLALLMLNVGVEAGQLLFVLLILLLGGRLLAGRRARDVTAPECLVVEREPARSWYRRMALLSDLDSVNPNSPFACSGQWLPLWRATAGIRFAYDGATPRRAIVSYASLL